MSTNTSNTVKTSNTAKTRNEVLEIISGYKERALSLAIQFRYYYGPDGWDTKYFINQIEKEKGKLTKQDLLNLSKSDLNDLGFGVWKKYEDGSELRLIPIELVPLLDENEEYQSISEELKQLKDCDKDIRFGCIAYGFKFYGKIPSSSLINQKKLDEIEESDIYLVFNA